MRDYKDEYKKFQSSKKEKKNRAKRNKIRLKFLKLGKVRKGDNKDVHHTNGIGNDSVEVMSSSENKGMPNEGGRKKNRKKRKYVDGGVSAPKGFHWMKKGEGKYKLMEHGDKPFKKHEGASLKAEFPIQKKHNPKKDAKMVKRKYVKGGGLWANIHAKRKRIAAGSVEKMRKPGSPGAPTAKALKESKAEEGAVVFNKPKRTPSHPTKSHMVIVRKPGGGKKTIRFGEQGASTAGKPKAGESKRMKMKRKSFKARHRKNIAKGKLSAAYWADKVKW